MISIKIISDAEAALALQKGNEGALEEIIRRYTGYVSAIVGNIVRPAMGADDMEETVSDVFFTLWKNREKAQPEKLRGYIASIARSCALNKLRALRPAEPLEEDFLELPEKGPEAALTLEEKRAAISHALESLSQRDREVFLRHYYYCQSTAVISEETEIKRETVKTILKSGREKLKRELTKKGGYCEKQNF